MVRLRIYYTNPTTKKVSHLSLQSNQYTKEEIDKIRVDYKKWMEAGNTSGDFRHNRLPDSRFKQPSESTVESMNLRLSDIVMSVSTPTVFIIFSLYVHKRNCNICWPYYLIVINNHCVS